MENDDKLSEYTSAVYLSGVVGDAALVLLFMLWCPKIGGVQPVFLAQKDLSVEVRTLYDIPNPYLN